eukprot:744431-Pyramimonas_sp.AAC.2
MLLQLGHAVLAVGFGWEDDVPYIVIRNSWTNEWGEGGYIRLKNNKDAQGWTDYSGPCGLDFFEPNHIALASPMYMNRPAPLLLL